MAKYSLSLYCMTRLELRTFDQHNTLYWCKMDSWLFHLHFIRTVSWLMALELKNGWNIFICTLKYCSDIDHVWKWLTVYIFIIIIFFFNWFYRQCIIIAAVETVIWLRGSCQQSSVIVYRYQTGYVTSIDLSIILLGRCFRCVKKLIRVSE